MAARLADRAHLRLRWLAAFLAAGLIAPPSLGAKNAANTSSGVVYCCKDADGQRICSDKLPHACYGRAYLIMKQGIVLQAVEAPLTPAERRKRAAEAAAR
ncbi:MAG: hypothetical protein II058_02975, partial [Rhodocyclaceae bacterium]|nr:hypothetical protein [Rhodocyclaceae bacterium]